MKSIKDITRKQQKSKENYKKYNHQTEKPKTQQKNKRKSNMK